MAKKRSRNRSNKNRNRKTSEETTKKTKAEIQQGQALVGLTAVTDAFVFAVDAVAKKDALRTGRKIRGQQLVENARRLDFTADQIVEAGKERATEIQRGGSQDASSLRARIAAQGLQVDFGTGQEAVEDILRISGQDASAIKINAFRQAHNLTLQASDLRSQANLDRIAGKRQEQDVLLTGGLNALRSISGGIQQADGFSAFG